MWNETVSFRLAATAGANGRGPHEESWWFAI